MTSRRRYAKRELSMDKIQAELNDMVDYFGDIVDMIYDSFKGFERDVSNFGEL